MAERMFIAFALLVAGVLAYRLLMSVQRVQANRAAAHIRAIRAFAGMTGRPALLVFTSPTCAACKLQQMPIVERLTTMGEWCERISLHVIDASEQPDVAERFGVWSVPTTIVLDASGEVAAINHGVTSEHKLRAQLERL